MKRLFIAGAALAGCLATTAGADEFTYQLDNNNLGLAFGPAGGFIIAVNQFNVVNGENLITSVLVDFFTGNDTMVGAGVWSDPNNDGDPADAVLLGTTPLQMSMSAAGLNEFVLPTPINVGADGTSFFVGIFYEKPDPNLFIYSDSASSIGRSWGRGDLNPADGVGDLSELIQLDLNWVIRANACKDCNFNGVPDQFETDCNGNGIPDDCDIADGTSFDCNCNGVPDECDLLDPFMDMNNDGYIDSCTACAGDTNCDGIVNGLDAMNVFFNLGTSGPTGDVNYDGTVNFLDYYIVIWNYGQVCN